MGDSPTVKPVLITWGQNPMGVYSDGKVIGATTDGERQTKESLSRGNRL